MLPDGQCLCDCNSLLLPHRRQIFRKYRRLQGGFIWDWADQGLTKHDPVSGRRYWADGGGFSDSPYSQASGMNYSAVLETMFEDVCVEGPGGFSSPFYHGVPNCSINSYEYIMLWVQCIPLFVQTISDISIHIHICAEYTSPTRYYSSYEYGYY